MDQPLGTKAHDNIIVPCKMGNTVIPKTLHSTNGAEVLLRSFHLYE